MSRLGDVGNDPLLQQVSLVGGDAEDVLGLGLQPKTLSMRIVEERQVHRVVVFIPIQRGDSHVGGGYVNIKLGVMHDQTASGIPGGLEVALPIGQRAVVPRRVPPPEVAGFPVSRFLEAEANRYRGVFRALLNALCFEVDDCGVQHNRSTCFLRGSVNVTTSVTWEGNSTTVNTASPRIPVCVTSAE